jgi:hypothetical protein
MMRRLFPPLFCTALLASACTSSSEDATAPKDAKADNPAKAEQEAPAEQAKPSLPDAAELLAASVEAVGGKAKLDSVQSFHLEGTIGAPKQGLSGKVETWWKGGNFYMVQTIPGLGINRSGKKDNVVWAEEPINGLRKLEGKEAEQHMWASSLLLPADWNAFFESATTAGERTIDGKKVFDIELVAKSGAKLTITLDATSHLMVEQAFSVYSPMGSMPVKIRSTDYRDVDGMKIPFKQVTDASLMELTQQLTKVELNAEVDEDNFGYPAGDVPVVDAKKPETVGDVPEPAPAPAKKAG